MSLNMAAIYSLLLVVTLAAFILQTVMSFIEISPIPGILFIFITLPLAGVLWGIVTIISVYIFFAEILNTISERHLLPLGNALFDFKNLRFQSPFRTCNVCLYIKQLQKWKIISQ